MAKSVRDLICAKSTASHLIRCYSAPGPHHAPTQQTIRSRYFEENRTIEQSNNRTIGRNWLLTLGLAATLAGCSTAQMEQFNRDLSDFNATLSSGLPSSANNSTASGAPRLATPGKVQGKNTQLVVPNDKAAAQAMEEALPIVKKVVAIHQCTMDKPSLRLLNGYGIPGSNFQDYYPQGYFGWNGFVGGDWRYHDKSLCPSVQLIDQWRMLALNVLSFRVVYFADDSGESDVFTYVLRKSSTGSWQLERFQRGGI